MSGPPRLFVSTRCLPGTEPLSARLARLAAHGLRAVELGGGVVCDGPQLDALRHTDLRFAVHNYFPPPSTPFVLNLASGDAAIRTRSMALVRRALDLCAAIGAHLYSVHAGFVTDPVGFGAHGYRFPAPPSRRAAQDAAARFAEALTAAAEHAAARGVTLLVENNVCTPPTVGHLLFQDAPGIQDLLARLPAHLGVGVLLDTGHLKVSATTLGFDARSCVERIAPLIRAFHLHDNDGRRDTHQPVRPDSWVHTLLRRPAFAGLPLIVEANLTDAAALAGHVRRLARDLAPADAAPGDTAEGP